MLTTYLALSSSGWPRRVQTISGGGWPVTVQTNNAVSPGISRWSVSSISNSGARCCNPEDIASPEQNNENVYSPRLRNVLANKKLTNLLRPDFFFHAINMHPYLTGKLPETSQLKCFPSTSLLNEWRSLVKMHAHSRTSHTIMITMML